jgi:hypothetical protein
VLREYRQEQQVERYFQLYGELYARSAKALTSPAQTVG